ncbi:MAG: serine/threonine-protein kinase [Lachnospiraceae bacterium]|nr:serine/threonine-protein kinase [Lachnospiraceae bacterium]
MSNFESGKLIPTQEGLSCKVVKYLAGGGQGDVYIVEYKGEKKALKWYKPNAVSKPQKFYDSLVDKARKGSPDKAFLWPLAVTQQFEGSFGYIMDLRPEGYYELCDFMLAKVQFPSFKAAVEACIRIVTAFRLLHNSGYCYQDMNDGNFFINPKTGDVLICDNDNVSPNKTDTFILGTPRYMAPEIVLSLDKPNTQTDRFSLSVVLFMILCMNHPFEGEHWLAPCLTPDMERLLYGSDATFLFDPQDDSNRPVPGVHDNVIRRWSYMPDYIQNAFLTAFSKDAIRNPARRLREADWLKVLVRFQSDIVRCPYCSNEVFIKDASDTPCDNCHKMLPVKHKLKLADYSITAAKGTRIYRCQIDRTCNADDALDRIGLVVAKDSDPNTLGFRNMTSSIFSATTPSGKARQVKPGEVVPLITGIRFQTPEGKNIEIQ